MLLPGGIVLPSGIPDLALWLRADAASINAGSPSNGDPVTSWYSREGNLYDFTQGTAAKRPTWNAADSNLHNRPTLTFDGTDDLLRYAGALTTATAGSALAVARLSGVDAVNAEYLLSSSDEATANNYLACAVHWTAGTPNMAVYSKVAGAANIVGGSTTISAGSNRIFGWSSSGTAWTLRHNGAAETKAVISGSDNGNWFGDSAGRDNVVIGARKDVAENYRITGEVAEVMLFDRELTAGEIGLMERYVSARYAIALA